jgi:hypothetical protein
LADVVREVVVVVVVVAPVIAVVVVVVAPVIAVGVVAATMATATALYQTGAVGLLLLGPTLLRVRAVLLCRAEVDLVVEVRETPSVALACAQSAARR